MNKVIRFALSPWLPKRVSKRCPAIIFAANRTDKVIGRIMFLISSIKTINGINAGGVPKGTKWAKAWIVSLIHENKIKESHKGSAKHKLTTRWLVAVKI